IAEKLENFGDAGRRFGIAHRDSALETLVIALRVDDAQLKPAFYHLFDAAGRSRGFAAARRTCNEDTSALRVDADRLSFCVVTKDRGLALDCRCDLGQIILKKLLDGLHPPAAAWSLSHDVRIRLDYWQRVGDRDTAAAGEQERMIIFRVTD